MDIKKELKDIAWNVPEETYRQDPAISYSTLAKFEREGFNNIEHLFDRVETPSLLFGSVVDCLMTDKENFDNLYFVADYPDIQDSQKAVADLVYSMSGGSETMADSMIEKAAIQLNYQSNWKLETRIKVIKEKAEDYYKMLVLAGTKKVINSELYQTALACIEALKSAPSTKEYFADDNPFDDNTKRYYQLKFKGSYEDIPIRCMSDLLYVNYEHKTIIPIDLKTSSKKEWDFPKSFIEWRYMIQACMYWFIIRQNLDNDEYFKDFKLENYRFIVINKETQIPMVWEFRQTQNIGDIVLGDYKFRNWRIALKELNYYLKETPKVPVNVSYTNENKIEDYFKNE